MAFATLTGLYITHVVEELRTRPTAIYEIRQESSSRRLWRLNLENISRSQLVVGEFYVVCSPNWKTCFEKLSEEDGWIKKEAVTPNFGVDRDPGGTAGEVLRLCLGAIPGSSTTVLFQTKGIVPKDELIVMYDAWSSSCGASVGQLEAGAGNKGLGQQSIFLLKPWHLHALLAKNYLTLFSIGFLVLFIALTLTGIFAVVGVVQKQKSEGKGEHSDETSRPKAFLAFAFDLTSRGDPG